MPPPLSFRTGAHTGEKLNRADFCGSLNTAFGGAISGREPCSPRKPPSFWMGAEAQKTCTRCLAALGMTGEGLPEPETMGFRLENAPRTFTLRADDGRRSPAARRRGFPDAGISRRKFAGSGSSSCRTERLSTLRKGIALPNRFMRLSISGTAARSAKKRRTNCWTLTPGRSQNLNIRIVKIHKREKHCIKREAGSLRLGRSTIIQSPTSPIGLTSSLIRKQ